MKRIVILIITFTLITFMLNNCKTIPELNENDNSLEIDNKTIQEGRCH